MSLLLRFIFYFQEILSTVYYVVMSSLDIKVSIDCSRRMDPGFASILLVCLFFFFFGIEITGVERDCQRVCSLIPAVLIL